MVKKFIYSVVVLFILSACSYSVYTSEYPYLKTIHVYPFENKTTEFVLSQDTQNSLVQSFMKDGRLKINTLNPDCEVKGSVLDYKKKIYSYDNAGNIQEYQIQILFSIEFNDLKMNQNIWQNKTLLLTKNYNEKQNTSTSPNTLTLPASEEEARSKIYEDLFNTIIKNTLESW